MAEIIACAIIAVVAIFGSTVFVWCLFQLNRRITDLESSRDDLITHALGPDEPEEQPWEESSGAIGSALRAGKRLDFCPSCGYTVKGQNEPRCQCVIDLSGT